MFCLGVIVGRGATPVLFETRPFQEHLGRMVSALSDKLPGKEKVDLKFYDVLEEPVSSPVKGKSADAGEITPAAETGKIAQIKPEAPPRAEDIPVKRSKKLATWHRTGPDYDNASDPAPPPKKSASIKTNKKVSQKQTVPQRAPKVLKSKIKTGKKTEAAPQKNKSDTGKKKVPAPGVYTIQIASHKDLRDALAHMVILNEKGITAYRVSVKINGETWHRVRTGSFADYKAASTRLAKIVGSGVKGMVIKKD